MPEKLQSLKKRFLAGQAGREKDNNKKKELQRLQELKKRYEGLEGLGEIILGGTGFRVEVVPGLESFAFDHQTKRILISPEFIEKMGLQEAEEDYVYSHEIGHFVQMDQDPDGYLETFEIAREKAKEWPEESQRREIEEAWRKYFNCYLDIHSNSIVEGRVPRFQKKREEPTHPRQTLYQKLFAKTDYRREPRHLQLLYASLRRLMRPGEEVVLSAEVEETFNRPFSYLGRNYASLHDFIKEDIFDSDLDLNTLLHRLRRVIEPIFASFLAQDAAEGKLSPENPELGRLADMDGGFSEKAVKEIIEEIKETKKTAQERGAEEMRRQFEDKARRAGLNEREIKRMVEITKRADDVFMSLVDLWRVFFQITQEPVWKEETGFRSGSGFSVERFVRDLPVFLTDPDKLRAFTRQVTEETKETIKPKKISLYLIPDLSGSMDNNKREAVQEALYALAKSLIKFRRDMAINFLEQEGGSPVETNLRIIGFGSSLKDLLPLEPAEKKKRLISDEDPEKLDQRLWQAVLDIQAVNLGGTEDALALEQVKNELTSEEVSPSFENNEEVAVIIEITDGETATEDASIAILAELKKMKNVFARGIRIPGLVYDERPLSPEEEKGLGPKILSESGAFERVWGKDGNRLSHIGQLREVMKKILFNALEEYKK